MLLVMEIMCIFADVIINPPAPEGGGYSETRVFRAIRRLLMVTKKENLDNVLAEIAVTEKIMMGV